MLTRDEVLLGFRLVLGREPESERTIEHHRNSATVMELGRVLRESDEFRARAARERIGGGEDPCWIRAELPSGLTLWVNLYDDGVSAGILRGAWEPTETNFMLSVLRPGDAVIDVGANLGWYTVTLAQAVGPNGHVFAFEPRSDIFAQLERSVQENGFADRCTLHRIALGLDASQRKLAWSPTEMNQGHSFIVGDDAAPVPDLNYETIGVTSLDRVGIERRIRLIKIDVEGGELDVLRGGLGLIARDQPIIVAEAFPKWLHQTGNTDTYSLLHALDDLNYRAHYITDDGIGGEVQWPVADLRSDYVYYSIVFLGAEDRAALLDGKHDGRVKELEVRIAAMADTGECLQRRAALAEERAAALAEDVQRLTDRLAVSEAELDRLKSESAMAVEQSAALALDVARLTRDLAAAEARARAAEFRNLESASQSLRVASIASEHGPTVDIETIYRSTSWRMTAPLRAMRRVFDRYWRRRTRFIGWIRR